MPDINGIPYVEATDLVSAYPGVSLALATELDDQLAAKLAVAGGKILQVVRATDTTQRTTTSTSFVDASISVTITPQKSDSAVLVLWSVSTLTGSQQELRLQITDSSNNAVSGAQDMNLANNAGVVRDQFLGIAYSTPATTSATTYKGRFRVSGGTSTLDNAVNTGQLYALEISA